MLYLFPLLVHFLSPLYLHARGSSIKLRVLAQHPFVERSFSDKKILSKLFISSVRTLNLRGGNEFSCVLHDVGDSDFTLSWISVPGATKYEVQLQNSTGGEFVVLSSDITTTMMRKKNLLPSSRYSLFLDQCNCAAFSSFSLGPQLRRQSALVRFIGLEHTVLGSGLHNTRPRSRAPPVSPPPIP